MAGDRSPRYPVADLAQAIEWAGKIYDPEGRSPVTDAVAAQDMGFSGLHGGSVKGLSALRKYGLLDRDGANNRGQR